MKGYPISPSFTLKASCYTKLISSADECVLGDGLSLLTKQSPLDTNAEDCNWLNEKQVLNCSSCCTLGVHRNKIL